MHPEFAKAVDPVFLACLQFKSRLDAGSRLVPADERDVIQRKIDEAEIRLGSTDEWKLAKYALCSWIDSMVINAQWSGANWWKDNCLEAKYFGRRDAHEEFFRCAQEAGKFSTKDALEVFYIAVVLGFRGFYSDTNTGYATGIAQNLGVPNNVDAWCRGVARSLQLRQGRPQIQEAVQASGSAKPLSGRTSLITFSLLGILFFAIAVSCAVLVFWKGV